jgi:hypothetical protein
VIGSGATNPYVVRNQSEFKAIMNRQVRIGIIGRDAFWRNAVVVEWEHQYPERKLVEEATAGYLIELDWLDDLKRIAQECFSKIVVGPADPSRRLWLRRFMPTGSDNKA